MLSTISVPRCLQVSGEAKSVTLHVFVDASENAYGAVIYMRSESKYEKVSLSFVTSTTKVTINKHSPFGINGSSVLGKRLALSVADALKNLSLFGLTVLVFCGG